MAAAKEGPRPPSWDVSRMATARCDVANAANAGAQVLVHFGARETREDGATGASLLHSVRLTPYAAKRLQDLLTLLVRDHDQRRAGAG